MSKKHKKNNNKPTTEMQRQMAIAYYKKFPVIFVERELGVELYSWQKWLLKFMFKWGFKNGK